ncbi:MAG: CPBP family intramembrane metalloprotease [Alphaproteobacteria bacterium]|nr:CPBP family intramembrane metalloprotease [Alphaproteobacteria bacterium]
MTASTSRSVFPFFALAVALSLPLWIAGASVGDLSDLLGIDLPVSALTAFAPMAAALLLTVREQGGAAAWALFLRAFDAHRVRNLAWIAVAALLMPALMTLAYGLMRWGGTEIPPPVIAPTTVLVFAALFLAGAIGEELGWQGYAYPRLRSGRSALAAAVALGLAWALWHVVSFMQTDHDAAWIFWQCLFTIAARVVTVWLYEASGESVFVAVLFHTMSNMAAFLFPVMGSHYDPALAFALTAGVAVVATLLWGPAMLARFRRPP